MEQVEVEVDRSKADVVTRYKERIELLFNVSVNLSLCRQQSLVEDGSLGDQTTFSFLLSSPDSQESVEKAKIFLTAALEESADFKLERHNFQPEEFEMILKNSQTIERESLAVIDFDLGTYEVSMKGGQGSVNLAKEQMYRLTAGQCDFDPGDFDKEWPSIGEDRQRLCHEGIPASTSLVGRNVPMPSSPKKDPTPSPVRDLDNNVILEPCGDGSTKSYSLHFDTENELQTSTDSLQCLVSRGVAPVKAMQLLSVKDVEGDFDGQVQKEETSDNDSPSSSESDNGTTFIDKSDKRYESKLEFAVKLGYSEQDLDKVLSKHGLNCDLNKLLRELIEGSTACFEEVEVESPSSVMAAQDLMNTEEFMGVLQKVNKSEDGSCNLRHIVIDGSNVAMSHGKNVFSCRGIKIAVDWFRQRGHKEITVFVPQWRKETSRPDTPISDQEILTELEKEGVVVFTPARRIKGRRVVCYDDRFVLKLAAETNGIVVSNDIYRDLVNESQDYRTVVEERLLMYTFVNDRFMPPEDPLGRHGPKLDNFLRKEPVNPPPLPQECPYGRKCTYGNKCKYHHPERGSQPHKTVTEVLKEQATLKMQERASKGPEVAEKGRRGKLKLTRTRSLVPEDRFSGERLGVGTLPPALQEPDTDALSKLKSPVKSPGKTADYLREHRKKLEEALAMEKALGPAPDVQETAYQEVLIPRAVETSSTRLPDPGVLSPVNTFGSRVSSPSHLNVPYSSSQEGALVSGHLLLAKKLSDEAETSFFSAESSSNRASPVALAGPAVSGVSRQESVPVTQEMLQDRRFSLQDTQQRQHLLHHQQPQQQSRYFPHEVGQSFLSGPSRLPSQQYSLYQQDQAHALAAYGEQCQSFPITSRDSTHSTLRRVISYVDNPATAASTRYATEPGSMHREHPSLKTQQSCPMNPFITPQVATSSRPFSSMMRQNSSSDPQLHMTATSEPQYGGYHSAAGVPPHSVPMLESHPGHNMYASTAERAQMEAHARQNLLRSASMQHPMQQPVYDRQINEGLFGMHDSYPSSLQSPCGFPLDGGSLFSGLPAAAAHPASPHPVPGFVPMQGARSGGVWQAEAPPMPTSPVKPVRYQKDQPIPPTDPRYPLYYNLCGIFAEPRVRAAMNLYPSENDPQKLSSIIMQLHL